jgi:hypothetical protein
MVKTDMYVRKDGALLVIFLCANGNLIGNVYLNGKEKRGYHDMRAKFRVKDGDATNYRVKEYFGFTESNSTHWWSRWA